MATAEEIQTRIAEAEAQRHLVALGEAVIEVSRGGRRVTRKVSNMKELNDYILTLQRELSDAIAFAEGRPRRRAVGLMWRN